MTQLTVACRCGEVAGTLTGLSATFNNHLICYCEDCQAFARDLGAEELAMDSYGGTRIVQVTPPQLRITQGAEQLACLRLTSKGPLRWYTACCNSPVANTVSPKLALCGIVASFITDARMEDVFGPVKYRMQRQHAIDPPPQPIITPAFPKRLIARIVLQLFYGCLRGWNSPSPFYHADGKPLQKPRRIEQ